MISNLRKFSKTILAKVLMFIIVIPFVFWGMGGVFSSGNTNSLAKINKHNISTEDLTDHFSEARVNLETLRENIDNNIIEEVLGNLVTNTLLQMEIENLSLQISEKVLIKKIKKNDIFLDDQKNFSRTEYEKFLLANNLTAPDFEIRLKKSELRDNLFTYIGGGIKSPFFITNNIYKAETKKLDISYINLINIYKKKESFTNKEIKSYIDENKDQLKNDHIDFSYIKLTPKSLTESDEYNEFFFEIIDQIENKIHDDFGSVNSMKEAFINAGIGGYSGHQAVKRASIESQNDKYKSIVYIACQNDFKSVTDAEKTLLALNDISSRFNKNVMVVLHTYMEYNLQKFLFFPKNSYWTKTGIPLANDLRNTFPDVCKKYDFNFLDWSNIVEEYKIRNKSVFSPFNLYADHCHLSPEGNSLMANQIAKKIIKKN